MKCVYQNKVKYVLSRFLAFLCILFFLPVMILIAVLIKLDSKGKVIFYQRRMGRDGLEFTIYKFRTMKEHAFEEGSGASTYESDPRITRVGKVIRKTSLDELPQLFNILLGNMCFIGPRPLLPGIPIKYEEYSKEHKVRFSVLPGMFCLVDTVYRAEASFETQCTMDAEYANHITLRNDVKIFFKTFRMVLLRKGIY